ncbi:MAG: hypothetical protein RL722_378 [Pseudomonadota bacterium]|jgi:formylglycine-generating enzyme required for sulfatase activity
MGSADRQASAAIGRATLLRALREARELTRESGAAEPAALAHSWAGLLGFQRDLSRTEPSKREDEARDGDETSPPPPSPRVEHPSPAGIRQPLAASFFVVTHFDAPLPGEQAAETEARASAEQVEPLRDEDCQPRSRQAPPHRALVPMTRLWPAVRRSLASSWPGGLDVPGLVRALAAACPPRRMPREHVSGIAGKVQVWWDVADHLTPYRQDYLDLLGRVHRLVGDDGLQVRQVDALPTQALGRLVPQRAAGPYRGGVAWAAVDLPAAVASQHSIQDVDLFPRAGSTVLVLGDAGNLAADRGAAQLWTAWLRELVARRCTVVLWAPCGAVWIEPAHTRLAQVHALLTGAALRAPLRPMPDRTTGARHALAERRAAVRDGLLTRAALCIHLAPPLLRSLRAGDALLAAEPAAEGLAWGAVDRVHRSQVSRALRPEWVTHYRQLFARLEPEQQLQALDAMLAAHATLGRSTETTEVLLWASHADPAVQTGHDAGRRVTEASNWVLGWSERMKAEAGRVRQSGAAQAFAADLLARLGHDAAFMRSQGRWVSRLLVLSRRAEVPPGLEQADVAAAHADLSGAVPGAGLLAVRPYVARGELRVAILPMAHFVSDRAHPAYEAREVWVSDGGRARHRLMVDAVGHLLAQAGESGQTVTLAMDGTTLDFTELRCPDWASSLGQDSRGVFAEIEVQGVIQRLRYIPPGKFLMGSPEGVGHGDEHPQHSVTLTEGYWLADTPCTQALWQAVMGDNPSHFKDGPDAAERPVENVSWDDVQTFLQRLRSLLPPGCDPTLPTEAQWEYAARAGTSTAYWWGDEADDTRANWNEQRQGTTPVRHFVPNPWGLHDVHGNVWEWCLDDQRPYTADPVRDPHGDLETFRRAVRGGSWIYAPDYARSACRIGGLRDGRYDFLGFRLSLRSPSPGAGGPGQGGGTGGPATWAGRPGAGGGLPPTSLSAHAKAQATASATLTTGAVAPDMTGSLGVPPAVPPTPTGLFAKASGFLRRMLGKDESEPK